MHFYVVLVLSFFSRNLSADVNIKKGKYNYPVLYLRVRASFIRAAVKNPQTYILMFPPAGCLCKKAKYDGFFLNLETIFILFYLVFHVLEMALSPVMEF